jgi:uncharacterized membrane protein
MLLAMLIVVGLTAVAAVAIVSHGESVLAGARTVSTKPATTPVDEAERILARRYARGEITAEEYDRMLVILRR